MLNAADRVTGRPGPVRRVLTPVEVVRGLGGRAERADVLRRTTQHHLQVALATGRLVRPGRGIYALPSLPDERIRGGGLSWGRLARVGGRLVTTAAGQGA